MYRADKRIYTTADGSEVVEENDPRAALLLAAEGQEITDDQAARLGLTGKKAAAPEPVVVPSTAADPEPKPDADEAKAAAPAESKAVSAPPETKARSIRKDAEDK